MEKETVVFDSAVKSLMEGMDAYLSAKTVVGEPVHVGDTVIVPLVNVSFGAGAGAFSNNSSGSGGGMGGKLTPSAVLVLKDGNARLINIATHTGLDKLLDMIPDFVEKFMNKKSHAADSDEVVNAREVAGDAIKEEVFKDSEVKSEIKE
ncbi:MAG: GerW family sporulation protein [Lachnospiraceae bacterium]|nr:GerW family sporulation protein [Lachnospiraceae bacterium]